MRNFAGVFASSLRNHPPISMGFAVGLNNSIQSCWGGALAVSTSLITMGAIADSGSSAPGEPPRCELARQLAPLSGACVVTEAFGTIEYPKLSGASGHGTSSSYVTA